MKPLTIIFPKISGYMKCFEESKYMSFFVKNEDLFCFIRFLKWIKKYRGQYKWLDGKEFESSPMKINIVFPLISAPGAY